MRGIAMAIIGLTLVLSVRLGKLAFDLSKAEGEWLTKPEKISIVTIDLAWFVATLYVIYRGL